MNILHSLLNFETDRLDCPLTKNHLMTVYGVMIVKMF